MRTIKTYISPFHRLKAQELVIRGDIRALDDWYEKHVGYRPSEEIPDVVAADYAEEVAEMMTIHVFGHVTEDGEPDFMAKAKDADVLVGPCGRYGTQFYTSVFQYVDGRKWRWLARDPDTGKVLMGIETLSLWDLREMAQNFCHKARSRSLSD